MSIMNTPQDLKYTKDHEWLKITGEEKDGKKVALVGITDFAQKELGDIVFLEIETVGGELNQGDIFGSVEAVKTVSDLFMPVSGLVLEKNAALDDQPELVNTDPYGEGWMIKVAVSNEAEIDGLMSAGEYAAEVSQ